MIVTTPVSTSGKTAGGSTRSMSVLKGLSLFDSCFPASICAPTWRARSPGTPAPPHCSLDGSHGEDLEQDTPSETASPSQSCRSHGTISTDASGNTADQASSLEANCPAGLTVQAKGLSPDQIGNIRKQLYTEGLNPAEREGGVAFFIPVTEDGMQPLTDGATVADRLTKTKKASLNYEERMILANINRQTQLFKRKQFAVRDIRNVRGATSITDMTERMKQYDGVVADFDTFLGEDINADIDITASYIRGTTVSTKVDVSTTKKSHGNTDCNVSVTEDESL